MTFLTHPLPLRQLTVGMAAGAGLWLGAVAATLPAIAQAESVTVAQATVIPASSAQQETLYLNRDRAYSYNLRVEQGVTVNGQYLPPGAEIQGQYVPAEGGLRYEANGAIVEGRRYALTATSDILTDMKDPRDTDAGSILEDAGIGAAGGLILGEVLGVGGVVEGAAAGAAVGNITADEVVVIEPDTIINLYL